MYNARLLLFSFFDTKRRTEGKEKLKVKLGDILNEQINFAIRE